MRLVTIATLYNPGQAQFVRSRLEAAEFHVFLTNETTSAIMPGFSSATAIRVQVPEDEAADAKEFLASEGPPAEE
jgi:hypothetical protein